MLKMPVHLAPLAGSKIIFDQHIYIDEMKKLKPLCFHVLMCNTHFYTLHLTDLKEEKRKRKRKVPFNLVRFSCSSVDSAF